MSELVLSNLDDRVLHELSERALQHGRTLSEEAKVILTEALHGNHSETWAEVDCIFDRLAASGRSFGESADLLREDRDR
jgi:plasmid stability protein